MTVTVNAVTQSAGVTITPSGGSVRVAEPGMADGTSGTYTVVLNTQPSANVTVSVSTDASQLRVSPASLTFTAQNWSMPQTVTVEAVDDQIAQGDHTVTIAHSATSADSTYNGISIASVPVSVTDGDFAAVLVDPGDNTPDLNEQTGPSATYQISLSSEPTANVTVTLTPDSEASLSAMTLSFTPANWDTPQSVTLTLHSESVAEGYHQTIVSISAASADAGYQGITNTVSRNIIDQDGPSALPAEVSTNENAAGTFDVLASDISPQGYPLSVSSVTQPSHGAVVINADGTLTYAPQSMWYGTDSFGYTLSDGHGGADRTTVMVTVNQVNRPPVVTNPGSQSSAQDAAVSLQINATDPQGYAMVYTSTGLPPGLVMDAMTGTIRGWIDSRAVTTSAYTPRITVTDLASYFSRTSFTWNVTPTDHPPILDENDVVSQLNTSYGLTLDAVDIDGNPLTYTVSGLPPGESFDPMTDQISGAPTAGGDYTVDVTVDDGHGGTNSDRFAWDVLDPDNPQPIASVYISGPGGASLGSQITMAHPAAQLQGTVLLQAPNDPQTPYTVTLVASGPVSLNITSATLTDGQSMRIQITPTGVSQVVGDATIRAIVAGAETSSVNITVAGAVLPGHIRGRDTPQSEVDRISIGTGNWGSYNAPIHIAPNLDGVYRFGLGVIRPAPDDKYGNAVLR